MPSLIQQRMPSLHSSDRKNNNFTVKKHGRYNLSQVLKINTAHMWQRALGQVAHYVTEKNMISLCGTAANTDQSL